MASHKKPHNLLISEADFIAVLESCVVTLFNVSKSHKNRSIKSLLKT